MSNAQQGVAIILLSVAFLELAISQRFTKLWKDAFTKAGA